MRCREFTVILQIMDDFTSQMTYFSFFLILQVWKSIYPKFHPLFCFRSRYICTKKNQLHAWKSLPLILINPDVCKGAKDRMYQIWTTYTLTPVLLVFCIDLISQSLLIQEFFKNKATQWLWNSFWNSSRISLPSGRLTKFWSEKFNLRPLFNLGQFYLFICLWAFLINGADGSGVC